MAVISLKPLSLNVLSSRCVSCLSSPMSFSLSEMTGSGLFSLSGLFAVSFSEMSGSGSFSLSGLFVFSFSELDVGFGLVLAFGLVHVLVLGFRLDIRDVGLRLVAHGFSFRFFRMHALGWFWQRSLGCEAPCRLVVAHDSRRPFVWGSRQLVSG